MMSFEEVKEDYSKFGRVIDSVLAAKGNLKAPIIKGYLKEILDDVFSISVQRGLSDAQCSKLLHFFLTRGICGIGDKLKILQNIVPEKKIPSASMREFMVWFTSNIRKVDSINMTTSSRILQWIIGLLEHDLVDSGEIYNFYDDLYIMLDYPSLIPYVAKLLCKLTKPDDVTSQTVHFVFHRFCDPSNKYLLAVLNVFKGYKPHLMLEDVKAVNVFTVLGSVPQSMDTLMKVRVNSMALQLPTKTLGICDVQTRNFSYFKEEMNKISSLIPLPTYNFEGMDKFAACYPNSIEEACKKFSRVPIPQNILSLMHNDVGFFTIMFQTIEVQMRFHNNLLQTLQKALIYQEITTSDEDVEFLFRRVCRLQTFMQQGIPCVSVFLSGYLLDWDGVDHRFSILNLIEWATFHTFRGLTCNILRPLHIQFVTNNTNMRRDIIRTLTTLIQNMFTDVSRVRQGIPFPFMKRGPKWTTEPESMLGPLIAWTENLITLGLSVEQDSSVLLLEAIRFYTVINILEASSDLPMFTVVSEGVVLLSLVSQNPVVIIRLCGLLLRYNQEFLPQLRMNHPHFYKQCTDKIGLTSNHAKQIMYFLQNGKVVTPRKESGIIKLDLPNESLVSGEESFTLDRHLCFVHYLIYLCETQNNASSQKATEDHLKNIREFIRFFSPSLSQ